MKKTKIVATLGLVSDTKETLEKMIDAGMNVARLNFSHGSYQWHKNTIKIIRELSKEKNISIGILADLQGPRIRTVVEKPVEIFKDEIIAVSDIKKIQNTKYNVQDTKHFLLDVDDIVDDIEAGNEILIEDGLMKIIVKEKNEEILICQVIDGGTINNHKGVNIPDANLHIDPITEKDQRDLEFVLTEGVDFVAMSFVGNGKNIEDLRIRMKKFLGEEKELPQIIAKIERKEAIKNLEEIIEHTDAVMVARGDLGIEIDGTKVAILQKEIIKKSLLAMKPVIVATQMLNSMIENPRPTRAEVSDVTNAVVDHADAVMLSGESASGKYPIDSVRTMKEIIENTENSPFDDVESLIQLSGDEDFKNVIKSAYELAKSSSASAIALGTASGFTARLFSHFRPQQKMLVVTHNQNTYNQLSLVWGVEPKLHKRGNVFREDIDWLIEESKKENIVSDGNKIVLVLGKTPDGEKMRLIGIKEV